MARKTARAALNLSDEQRRSLTELARSRTAAVREVERAR
ncbi:IS630 family transposase, partial [Thiococcus pfennigii]|nr:IS630 family transposase [Thiococcus pfennigii]MBK1733587.1 IS630 family transposase [Thiococcus pfennigii]